LTQYLLSITMSQMRTTLTIEPDLARLLEQEAQRSRKPFEQVVNEALRLGLTRPEDRPHQFLRKVYDGRLRPGCDPAALNALSDALEDESMLGKVARSER
jgi:hypothetical protein